MRVQLTGLTGILFICTVFAAQAQDTLYQRQDLVPSDIALLLSYYNQDGDHSAVTGGAGTEKLKVYSVKFNYKRAVSAYSSILWDLGIDVISSASTDRIDFNMSSASRKDGHETMALGFVRQSRKIPLEYGFKINGSLESDYMSRGFEIWANRRSTLTTYGADLKVFLADLRWGWFNKPFLKPSHLIYPSELRDTAWFSSAHRTSYNLSMLVQRELTPDVSLGIYPVVVLQRGLLSTPFHRVYFADGPRARVENLPDSRLSVALGMQLNKRFKTTGILRTHYQFYTDDFGMGSHALHFEFPFLLTPTIFLSPSVRAYRQSASDYFAPHQEHLLTEEFYTSDYDLSAFWSTKFGLGITFDNGRSYEEGNWRTPGIALRYSFYRRSDGLRAHIFSALFKWTRADRFRPKSGH